jgi:hypothetical protein
VTLAVAFGGPGLEAAAARADHTHAASGNGNTKVGEAALDSNTSGTLNTAIGFYALANASAGVANTAVGDAAARDLVSGSFNTAVGADALVNHFSGDRNTAVGYRTALNGGARNTALGAEALSLADVGGAVGTLDNTAVGERALRETWGNNNTAVGSAALDVVNAGDDNVAVGANALGAVTSGANNIAVGTGAGGALTSGSDNIFIGHPGVATDSSTIRIGRAFTHTRFFVNGVRGITTGNNNAQTVVIDSAGQLGTVSSSRRTKFDIADLDSAVTAGLQALRPVQFRYRQAFADGSTPLQYGLIAEEVQEVLPELVATDDEGQPASVKYHVLPALLLADVQRLERERQTLHETVAEQRRAIDAPTMDLAALRAQMDRLVAAAGNR